MELTWLVTANVKAYDVIGVRLSSGLSITNYTFKQYHTVYGARQQLGDCSYKTTSSGLGASFHLGEGTDNLITLSFIVSGSGTIFGAYQHATSSKVTLANSLDYSFSPYGYGNVFKFSSSVANYYDQMSGVDISI